MLSHLTFPLYLKSQTGLGIKKQPIKPAKNSKHISLHEGLQTQAASMEPGKRYYFWLQKTSTTASSKTHLIARSKLSLAYVKS